MDPFSFFVDASLEDIAVDQPTWPQSAQVIHLLLSHSDTVSAILRQRSPAVSTAQLEETALLTSVICRATGWDSLREDGSSKASAEIQGQLNRLEQASVEIG